MLISYFLFMDFRAFQDLTKCHVTYKNMADILTEKTTSPDPYGSLKSDLRLNDHFVIEKNRSIYVSEKRGEPTPPLFPNRTTDVDEYDGLPFSRRKQIIDDHDHIHFDGTLVPRTSKCHCPNIRKAFVADCIAVRGDGYCCYASTEILRREAPNIFKAFKDPEIEQPLPEKTIPKPRANPKIKNPDVTNLSGMGQGILLLRQFSRRGIESFVLAVHCVSFRIPADTLGEVYLLSVLGTARSVQQRVYRTCLMDGNALPEYLDYLVSDVLQDTKLGPLCRGKRLQAAITLLVDLPYDAIESVFVEIGSNDALSQNYRLRLTEIYNLIHEEKKREGFAEVRQRRLAMDPEKFRQHAIKSWVKKLDAQKSAAEKRIESRRSMYSYLDEIPRFDLHPRVAARAKSFEDNEIYVRRPVTAPGGGDIYNGVVYKERNQPWHYTDSTKRATICRQKKGGDHSQLHKRIRDGPMEYNIKELPLPLSMEKSTCPVHIIGKAMGGGGRYVKCGGGLSPPKKGVYWGETVSSRAAENYILSSDRALLTEERGNLE